MHVLENVIIYIEYNLKFESKMCNANNKNELLVIAACSHKCTVQDTN